MMACAAARLRDSRAADGHPPRGSRRVVLAIVVTMALLPTGEGAAAQQKFALEIPRVTAQQLEANATLRSGLHAYVLIDWASQWKSTKWTLEYLKNKIPLEWVDYYAKNMKYPSDKPYLKRFKDALPKFLEKTETPKYMQLRLGLSGWQRIKEDFNPKPVPDIFWDDDEWIAKCMKNHLGEVDEPAIDNFFTTQQWKFLLIGETGTQMFFHKDATAASTWQAQLIGRKRWTICPNTESRWLNMKIDTFNPDYQAFPRFAQAYCGQVTVAPGELLYYPAYWWHHPWNLDTPTVSYTGALVGVEADRTDLGGGDTKSHLQFYKDIVGKCEQCWERGKEERKCRDISAEWPGAAPPVMRVLCDNYLPECYKEWEAHAQALHGRARNEL